MGCSLRHTKSEENLTGGEQSTVIDSSNISMSETQQNMPPIRQTPVKNISPYSVRSTDVAFNFPDDDPNDCWSQEDDEITQQVGWSIHLVDTFKSRRETKLIIIYLTFFYSIYNFVNQKIGIRYLN